MKEFVQKPGVRPWHGNELVSLQAETLEAMQRFLKPFRSFVLDGCDYSGTGPYSLSAGLVFIEHPTDGFKIARYAGGDTTNGLGLLYLTKTTTHKLYDDGNNHDAVYEYTAIFLDALDPGFAALDASLTDTQKIYLVPIYDTKFDFDVAFKAKTLPDWVAVTNPNLSTPEISSFSIHYRINRATGQVFLKGTITIQNDFQWIAAKWIPVVDLGMNSLFSPQDTQYFTGTAKYGLGDTFLFDDGSMDLLTTFGLSVSHDRKLYLGARRCSDPAVTYIVNFSGYYFWG